ncbi:hypothetical protein NC652_039294 [Populus alba x Populus x berolinensis]|nr:hypothetical protein NC652_039294 [Populus alba x Populus x berolinensis]
MAVVGAAAKITAGLRGGEVSLAAITKILNVERVGGAHHARSDSLLMARVYTKMRMATSLHRLLLLAHRKIPCWTVEAGEARGG